MIGVVANTLIIIVSYFFFKKKLLFLGLESYWDITFDHGLNLFIRASEMIHRVSATKQQTCETYDVIDVVFLIIRVNYLINILCQ
jgi:hypothetical protein